MLRGLQALMVTMTVMSTMRMGTHGRAVPSPPLGTGEPRLQPLLLNVAEKLLTDSQTALNDYVSCGNPPAANRYEYDAGSDASLRGSERLRGIIGQGVSRDVANERE
ncbi:unnamed protein product [Lampetra fluviatilis]